jgi:hypothetical protein
MATRRWLALGLVLALAAPATAQEAKPVKLEWKFEKDKTFYQTLTTEATQTVKLSGRDVTRKNKQTYYLSWTPTKQEDKYWFLKMKVEGLRLDIDGGDDKVTFDSTRDDNPPGPLSNFFKELSRAEFTLKLNAEMQSSGVEGADKLIEALGKASPQMKLLVIEVFSPGAVRQLTDAAFPALPGKEVKKGDTWKRQNGLILGPLGTYEATYTYTAEGPDKDANVEKIGVKVELTYKKPSESVGRQPIEVKSADFKTAEGSGTVEFRKDKGRAEKSNVTLTLKGKLNIVVGGTATDVEADQTLTTTVITSDEDPLKKK